MGCVPVIRVMKHVLIAGAGIVGVASAIWLQRAGCRVTLIDRAAPGSGTSHGNAGILAAGAVMPVTTPGLLRKAPSMLFDRDAPLFLRWSYLPRLLPFLMKYLAHNTDAHVNHYARSMASLLHDSVQQHQSLAAGTGAEKFISHEDYCFGYQTQKMFEADGYGWSKRRAEGVKHTVVSGAEYSVTDPTYDGQFEAVVRCHNHGRISDPGAYVRALADHFIAQGGTFIETGIHDVTLENGQITSLSTDQGKMSGDTILLAMGPWSKPIAHKLGVKVPFESERGYHIELMNPSSYPKNPMMVASGKFVITPMDGRIRAAGVIEFGGLNAPASRAPLELLSRQVAQLLPDTTYDDVVEWMGHRPAPADSLPLIGANDAHGKSYSAFGHQHVGLTGSAKTGRIIADLIAGKPPNIDLTPFDPQKHKAP